MNVLLAEDNLEHQRLLGWVIRKAKEDARVTNVGRGSELLRELELGEYDVCILDYHLPDYEAPELLPKLDELEQCPPVIIVSSDDASETIIAALRCGGSDFIRKDEAFEVGRLVGRIRDVLRRKQAEQRMIATQRDECLSVLAGGIAHDFNNMLVGILGKVALLRNLAPGSVKHGEYCDGISRTAERLADLAKQLLAYARGGKYHPQPDNANEAVRDTLAMLQGAINAKVKVRTYLSTDLWTIEADHSQIVQALLNLCLNAADAMPEGGTLSLFSENITEIEPWRCARDQQHEPGEYVQIIVADTGCGIPPAVMRRMFEPYYSTKGQARGLGLAAVNGIVHNHGGAICVESSARGTRFRLRLPRLTRKSAPQSIVPVTHHAPTNARRVLLVDDEPEVVEVGREVLSAAGHEVVVATTGSEAETILQREASVFDVMVLDMQLPDRHGSEVYATCRRLAAEMPIIVCSGYDRESAMHPVLAEGERVTFLPKPFGPEGLLRALDEATAVRFASPTP